MSAPSNAAANLATRPDAQPGAIPACVCIEDEAPVSVWWRIGGAAFLAMNGMVFSIALNGSEVTSAERYSLELTLLSIAIPVFLLLAKEFLEASWRAIRRGQLSIELLFLIGITASLAASVHFFTTGQGNGYADIAAMLLVVYALGRQIGAYGKQRLLRSLDELAPSRRMARRIPHPAIEGAPGSQSVPASQLRPGDRIRILPGETVPADARIVAGTAFVHEASLNGESFASRRQPGHLLTAGTHPLDASLDAEVTGAESQLDRIHRSIEASLLRPGVEQAMAVAALRWFVPLVILASLGAYLYHGDLRPAMAVAVVACPCALGFATPLAVWTAMERLRELGIATRRGDAIERLAEIDTVVFDKTGTLTLPGEYDVTLLPEPAWQSRLPLLRWYLREAELASNHPLARALAPLWTAPGNAVDAGPALASIRLIPGTGIEASFADGTTLFSGKDGRHLQVHINGRRAAAIELHEKPGAAIPPAVAALEALGIEVVLATGDAPERAGAMPIRTRLARLTPEEKHAYLASLHAQGRKALFAGDGLNDAAAMAWSHVACAAPHSTPLVAGLSGIIFLHYDWRHLAPAIALARKTRQVIRWNIIFSLSYNLAGIAAAAAGWLHPVASALLMTASSLTVILYSMHLMDWEIEPQDAPRTNASPQAIEARP